MPPEQLLIVGTGGLAREAAQLARRIDARGLRWHSIGFVGRTRDEVGAPLAGGSVLYCDDDLTQLAEPADVVIAIGHPAPRRAVASRLRSHAGLRFPNLIHPGLEVDTTSVQMGVGNMLTLGVVMTCDIRIGDFNLVNWNTTIGHDAVVGSYNVINPASSISGHVQLADACLLGTGCRVLEGLTIGSGVTIGAGAVVTRSIAEPGVWVGVPARELPPR
ncbi:MAG TPA: NeuD/PglB/VioB family sugar acetyltransferase [Rubrivivax sp.]|nr:NeuD/PglB/VioB family sugar acetyltransferase [Rubrivivax sp.]